MTDIFFMLAQKQSITGGQNPIIMIVFMVLFIAFFYFVVIRPQNKKKKEAENMLKAIKKGDKVVTIGGAHGKVVTVKDDVVVLKIDDNAEITFDKSAIARVINPNPPANTKDNGDKKSDKNSTEQIENNTETEVEEKKETK